MLSISFEKFFALILIIFLSPFLVVLGILNFILMGWPIFFVQERIGLHEKPFKLIKFRSMRFPEGKEWASPLYLSDAQRLTAYGCFLRKYSLDELPSLWNILKGEMSFVGPRPFIIETIGHYTDYERKRHQVKPGLTGLAQIKGRNNISWKRRLRLDVWYVNHKSLSLDLYILRKTILLVFSGEGTGLNQEDFFDKNKSI